MPNADREWPLADRFRLSGPSVRLDPRTHAFRRDIADIVLADRVFAPHYARGQDRTCTASSAMLHCAPDATSSAVSQLLRGEEFAVIDCSGGWAWGYGKHDDYVGYLREDALGQVVSATHIVTAPVALVFAAPDVKAPVIARWPMGACLHGQMTDGFVACSDGFLHARHVAPAQAVEGDAVSVAERLIGAPYLWGGRGAGGIDCSGLVQLALRMCGQAVPRDTDLQRAAIGSEIAAGDPLRRGDIIFFPGHVGMMVDAVHMVHANAFWMAVTVEPLADVVARLADTVAEPVLARRRLTA